MRVWNLLLIGILTIHCQQQQSPTNDPNSKSPPVKKSTFTRISDSLDAHARLTIALNSLAELLKPTNRYSAIAKFSNINQSIFSHLLEVQGRRATKVIQDLSQIKTDSIYSKLYLGKIQQLEHIYKTMNATVIPGKEQKNEMNTVMGAWKAFNSNPLDLKKLEEYKTVINSLKGIDCTWTGTRYSLPDSALAVLAMEKFPGELKLLLDQVPTLKEIEKFHSTFWDTYHLVTLIKSYQTPAKLDSKQLRALESVLVKSTSFYTPTKVASALDAIVNEDHSFSLKLRDELIKDLEDNPLRSFLNNGEEMKVLKTVLKPFFDVEPVLKFALNGIVNSVENKDFKKKSATLSHLLNTLQDIRIPSSNDFNQTFHKFRKWIDPQFSIPQDVGKFLEVYKSIADGLDSYQKFVNDVEVFKQSEDYKKSVPLTAHISALALVSKSTNCHYFNDVKSSGWLETMMKNYETIIEKMEAFNAAIKSINDQFSKISEWKGFEEETEKWLETTIKDFGKPVDPISVSRIKTGFEFIELHNSIFKSSPSFTNFIETCSKLESALKIGMEKVDDETEALKGLEEDPFNRQVIILNQGFELREKLVAGSKLFKFFDRVILNLEKFEEFFKQGDAIGMNIQGLDWTVDKRFDFIQEMKFLNSTRVLYEQMKQQILARESYYKPDRIDEIMNVRRLIESLADIPNPMMKTEHWSKFAEDLDPYVNVTLFTSALGAIFDLDFANHQKQVGNAYANLRGLIRFHMTIEAMEKVKKNTFWNYNQWWIKFLGFAIITLVLNAAAYKYTYAHFKKQEKKEAENAKRKERKRLQLLWDKMNKEQLKEEAKSK